MTFWAFGTKWDNLGQTGTKCDKLGQVPLCPTGHVPAHGNRAGTGKMGQVTPPLVGNSYTSM